MCRGVVCIQYVISIVEQFVRSAARTMVEELGRRPDFIKLMFIEIVEFNGSNMPNMLDHVLPQVLPLIERFKRQGGVLRPMPPFVFFRAFLGLFFSYYMTELLLANMPIAQQQGYALDQFVEIFLHGILAN